MSSIWPRTTLLSTSGQVTADVTGRMSNGGSSAIMRWLKPLNSLFHDRSASSETMIIQKFKLPNLKLGPSCLYAMPVWCMPDTHFFITTTRDSHLTLRAPT